MENTRDVEDRRACCPLSLCHLRGVVKKVPRWFRTEVGAVGIQCDRRTWRGSRVPDSGPVRRGTWPLCGQGSRELRTGRSWLCYLYSLRKASYLNLAITRHSQKDICETGDDGVTVLKSKRLLFRPFSLDDAHDIQRLANDWEVATTVPSIPHPYPDGVAESWVNYLNQAREKGTEIGFAIVQVSDNVLVGSISLMVNKAHRKCEIGYWLGRNFWGNGYATEACWRIIDFGFTELELNKIFAPVMTRNKASIRVLEKAGMKYEGTAVQRLLIRGVFEDIVTYGIIKTDYVPQ